MRNTLILCDCSAALPGWQWAALPIMRERHADRDSIDTDGELVSAYRLAANCKDALDQWHAQRHVNALGEEGRKGVRLHGDDEVCDSEPFDWLNTVNPIGTLTEPYHSNRGAGLVSIENAWTTMAIDIVISVTERVIVNRVAVCAAKLDVGSAYTHVSGIIHNPCVRNGPSNLRPPDS
jgi:hypothetical protein